MFLYIHWSLAPDFWGGDQMSIKLISTNVAEDNSHQVHTQDHITHFGDPFVTIRMIGFPIISSVCLLFN